MSNLLSILRTGARRLGNSRPSLADWFVNLFRSISYFVELGKWPARIPHSILSLVNRNSGFMVRTCFCGTGIFSDIKDEIEAFYTTRPEPSPETFRTTQPRCQRSHQLSHVSLEIITCIGPSSTTFKSQLSCTRNMYSFGNNKKKSYDSAGSPFEMYNNKLDCIKYLCVWLPKIFSTAKLKKNFIFISSKLCTIFFNWLFVFV